MSLRSAAASAIRPPPCPDAAEPNEIPQAVQKRWPGVAGAAQAGQNRGSASPHSAQKNAPGAAAVWQLGHEEGGESPSRGGVSETRIVTLLHSQGAYSTSVLRLACTITYSPDVTTITPNHMQPQ